MLIIVKLWGNSSHHIMGQDDDGNANYDGSSGPQASSREVEIKSKINFIKTALKNLKSNFPQFKSVSFKFKFIIVIRLTSQKNEVTEERAESKRKITGKGQLRG